MLSRKLMLSILILLLTIVTSLVVGANMINGNGQVIPRNVLAEGGGRSTNSVGITLEATIGQPALGKCSSGAGPMLVGGFQTMIVTKNQVSSWNQYH